MAIITISRQAGSGAEQIARRVCELLDYGYLDKELMASVARERGITRADVVDFSEDNYRTRSFLDALLGRASSGLSASDEPGRAQSAEPRLLKVIDEEMAVAFVTATIRALRDRGRVVVVGRGGQAILRGSPGVLHVRITAPMLDRIRRLGQEEGMTDESAQQAVNQRDRATAEYLRRFHGIEWEDPTLYHVTINSSLMPTEAAAGLIADAAQRLDARLK